ncbi:TPA: capsid protein [Enterococcus faecium]|uniref:capsid protein n=1 Tax=Bacilli TaxID=91061 RepID=UPI000BF415D1|nr:MULTISPECIES: capsid protein [Bacilli]KAF3378097.1 capsid protein [Enterococcus faecium]MBE9413616.1 capsid protein [Enterococcus faecium]MBE9422401.1 capsid protein [Staphylococcus epidermidis]MBE9452538.1 capsid protein [Staphylococcus epidermidis]PEX99812.1 capsid protein [Enterococcus faecium]
MTIKYYTKQYAGMLPNLFEKKAAFLRAFGGTLQVKDGISQKDTFLELKISDTDVVIQGYSTDANVGFGTGTGSTSRFGVRKEVKSVDKNVPYEAPLSINEGIDDFTVNDIPAQVVAERLALHGVAWAQHVDGMLGKAISDNASETLTGELTEAGIAKLFADAHKKFVNNGVSSNIAHVAYVTSDVLNFLIDSDLAKTEKNSSANVDEQTLYKFKGFVLIELPDAKFQTGEQVYFVADNVGVAGVGIQVVRTMDSEDFAGTALQAAAKYGKYIPDVNKKAILKAKLTEPVPAG